jgi:hypothetical protein
MIIKLKDPSIQQVAQNTANNNQNLDDYDPFSQSNSTSTTNQPATLETTNPKLPAYSASGQQYQVNESANGSGVTQISTAELQVSHDFV